MLAAARKRKGVTKMTTDTLMEASLEEAEAIVRAEWLRLQRDTALAESPFVGAGAEAPAARPRPTRVAAVTTTLDRPGGPPAGSRQGTTRRRQDPVWPTQRFPPTPNQSRDYRRLPNGGDALTDNTQAGSDLRATHSDLTTRPTQPLTCARTATDVAHQTARGDT